MRPEVKAAVQKVLRESSDHENFTGWSFAQRLAWMIAKAYTLGTGADYDLFHEAIYTKKSRDLLDK